VDVASAAMDRRAIRRRRGGTGVDFVSNLTLAERKAQALRAHRTQHESIERHFFSQPDVDRILSVEAYGRRGGKESRPPSDDVSSRGCCRAVRRAGFMPELPDILLYLHALCSRDRRPADRGCAVASPFLLRSIDPLCAPSKAAASSISIASANASPSSGRRPVLVFHLMIAGRFRWKPKGARVPGKVACWPLTLTTGRSCSPRRARSGRHRSTSSQGGRRRSSMPGGLEVLDAGFDEFAAALTKKTTREAIADRSHLFSGIGNAYSDEILHAARLSPSADAVAHGRRAAEALRLSASRLSDGLRGCSGKRERVFLRR